MATEIRTKQRGYFLLLAVIFILVIGIMGYAIAYNFATRAKLIAAEHAAMQVFYQAESGAEITTRLLTGSNLVSGQNLTCDTVNNSPYVTNASIGDGTFTATAVGGALFTGTSALSSSITSTSNSVTLNSTTGFAPQGRIRVDSEAIDYASISGNTLIGLSRDASSTASASHNSGAAATQSICLLNISAGIPSITSPTYLRTLTVAIEILPDTSDLWAVGDRHGNRFTIIRWNQPISGVWNTYAEIDVSNREDLYAVNASSNTNAWSAGDEKNNQFTFVKMNGSTWSQTSVAGACTGQNLKGVSTISTSEAFAVGVRYRPGCVASGNYRYTILKWDGTSWSPLTPSSSPSIPADAASNSSLNAISMLDSNGDNLAEFGFAVGDNGQILQYNGTNWINSASGVGSNLLGVSVVSANEAWAISHNGGIIKWNGSSWSSISSPTTTQLNAISMLDTDGDGFANSGWAVGNNGVIIYYNGGTWSTQTNPDTIALTGVVALTSTTAWAVGLTGEILKCDNNTWAAVSSPTTRDLRAIAFVRGNGSVSGIGNPSGNWAQSS